MKIFTPYAFSLDLEKALQVDRNLPKSRNHTFKMSGFHILTCGFGDVNKNSCFQGIFVIQG